MKELRNGIKIIGIDHGYRNCDDPYFETREKEDEFVQRVVAQIGSAVEKAMPSFLAACLTGLAQPCIQVPQPEQPKQAEEITDVDLDFIGGQNLKASFQIRVLLFVLSYEILQAKPQNIGKECIFPLGK